MDGTGATPLYPYEETTLDNGLRVITLKDHTCPVAAVHLWYHVGSRHEAPDRRGFAHMFEHMMFRGSERLGPEDHFNFIRRTGGDANAYTGFDQTVYVQDVPANQVELVFWLESERMAFLRIDEEGFRTEREVVAEELRMIRDAPYGTLADQVLARLFPDHPYASTPGGDIEHLRRASVDELQTFWERFYVPGNATLVVVGDVQHGAIQDLARRYFGWIPRFPEPAPPALPPLDPRVPPIRLRESRGPAPVVALGYRGVPAAHPDRLPLEILLGILGAGESSRLYRRLVAGSRLAVMAAAQSISFESEGLVGAAAILHPIWRRRRRTLKVLREEIDRLRREGPTDDELRKALHHTLRDEVVGLQTAATRAQTLGGAAVLENDLPGVNSLLERTRRLTREELREKARQYLAPEREIELTVKPSLIGFLTGLLGGGTVVPPAVESAPETSAPPGTGKPGLVRPAEIPATPPLAPPVPRPPDLPHRTWHLPNGLQVFHLHDPRHPFVTLFLGQRHGAATEDPAVPGTASLAAQMITRGTPSMDEAELAYALESLAISCDPQVDMDTTTVTVGALREHVPRAFELLSDMVVQPAFPEASLGLLRSQNATALRIQMRDGGYLANRTLRRVLYGDHPYARDTDGDLTSLSRITRDRVRDWWKTHVQPESSVLFVAGDLPEDEARDLTDRAFRAWKGGATLPEPTWPDPPRPESRRIHLVPRRGRQAQIRVGVRSITREDPRYFDAQVLMQIFGGGFNSRLNRSLRVEKGLTYGAAGSLTAGRHGGELAIQTFSGPDTTVAAVEAILGEIDRLSTAPPTEEEVTQATTYLQGSYVLSRETIAATLADLWLVSSLQLPEDHLERYLAALGRCRAETLRPLGGELFDADALQIVVVGPKTLRAPLEAIAPVSLSR